MIGIPFELDLSTLPPAFEPKRIVRDEFHWPGYREPGEVNNVDQIGAWSLLADLDRRTGPTGIAKTAIHNAREWILHYHRMDGGQKDEAHLFLPGIRHYLRVLDDAVGDVSVKRFESLVAEASALFTIYGRRSLAKLAEYTNINKRTGKPYLEPRVVGRALSNAAAYVCHQFETGQMVPKLEVFSTAIRNIAPATFTLDPQNPDSTGWSKSASGVRYLVAKGYERYTPSIEDPYFHYIPWQYFSTLAYGILEAFSLLDESARAAAQDILRSLHALAKEVTLGFTQWGGTNELATEHDEGMVRRLIPFQGNNKLLPLQPEESSSAERTYSFRWLSENARPMMEGSHIGFQPTCLPLKNREELLEL